MKRKLLLPLALLLMNFGFVLANDNYPTTANNEQITNFSAVLAPKNLKVHFKTHETIMLSFENYNRSVDVQEFEIYQDDKLAYTTRYRRYNLEISPVLTYTITGLTPATSYNFKVRAKDVSGNYSDFSETLTVSTLEKDIEAPTAPTNLSFRQQGRNSGVLGWKFSTDNVAVGAYDIYLNGNVVKRIHSTSTSFVVNNLQENTEYKLSVRAIDTSGNVSDFSEVTVTLKSLTPPTNNSNATLNVYPNPAVDILNVDFTATVGTINYSIFDASKRPVRVQRTLTTNQIDVSGLKPGLYYLVVQHNLKSYVKPFYKK